MNQNLIYLVMMTLGVVGVIIAFFIKNMSFGIAFTTLLILGMVGALLEMIKNEEKDSEKKQ